MGILGRGHSSDGKRAGTTVIAGGTKLVGDLTLTDNLHVDGALEGAVHSEAEISIGEQGQVQGDIVAKRVLVSGQFSGTIDTEQLEIVASGVVEGTVKVDRLMIESGARFNGSSEIRKQEPPKQLGHDSQNEKADKSKDGAGKKA